MDNGFPLTTEPSILRDMIAPPNIVSKMLSVVTGKTSNVSSTLPNATSSCVPWRKTDSKYASNEIYVDLVEEMDAVVNRSEFDVLNFSLYHIHYFSKLQYCLPVSEFPLSSLAYVEHSITTFLVVSSKITHNLPTKRF